MSKDLDYKYNLKVYWSLLKNYKGLALGVVIAILIMEAARVGEKFLFKRIVDDGGLFTSSLLTSNQFVSSLMMVLFAFMIISFLNIISKWFHIHFLNRLDASLMVGLKRKYFSHLIYLSHNFHTSNKSGSIISRLIRGGNAIERLTDVLTFNFVPFFIQLFIIVPSLLLVSWQSALIIICTSLLFILYSLYLQYIQVDANSQRNLAEDREKGMVADVLTNVDSIHYYGKEKTVYGLFKNLSGVTKDSYIKAWDYYRSLDAGQAIILSIGAFLVIYFPIVEFMNGSISIGDVVFIFTIYLGQKGPMIRFANGTKGFYRAMSDFDELFKYGKVTSEIQDKDDAKDLSITKGEINFNNISFNYGKRKLFKNFTLKVKPNQKVALVGHSGSGKTTLVKLLYRFHDIQKGSIQIDGNDIKDLKQHSLRSEMSIVPQECILFDDTIYNNVAFSRPDATKKEVFDAIKFAQLDKIIKHFPQKEKTIVGERGVKLSGGEKQRVSIARAILANKKILVLDEATSALDSQTEHDIQQDLQKLMQGRTTLIIAHRLSTIMSADVIVVLKEGKIMQMGTHKQLIRKRGEYKHLWDLQKGGYIGE